VVHALRGVSLRIENGEFLSIAGPSGSGKSTLLNIIGCIDTATSGFVTVDDQMISGREPRELTALRRRKIGFVFQSFNLIPVLTAYENVAFSLMLLGVDDKDAEPRVRGILEEVGLAGLEDRLPAQLSGGQQQRVAVARALVKEPSLVLADEPTANLDSDTGESILELMRDLNRRRGTTFVFSTHDKMVMEFADRLALLHDGRIVDDDRRTA
jgi:putative ABC transport system ATP-binding protein